MTLKESPAAMLTKQPNSERGNAFFYLFAAVGMVAILSSHAAEFISGPLTSSANVSRSNNAQTQMGMAAKLAAFASLEQANGGDCDTDGYAEPILPRAAGAAPAPIGGGLIPSSIGAALRDPWGTDYGLCVWDHGPATCGGRLAGADSNIWPSIAIISAGPDKTFQTTCRDFIDTNTNGQPDLPLMEKLAGSDDIATSWTYAELVGGASSGGGNSFPTINADEIDDNGAGNITTLAPLDLTQPLSMNGTEIIDAAGLIVSGEQDPKIGTVNDGQFCTGNASGVINCETPPPSGGGGIVASARTYVAGLNAVDIPVPISAQRITVNYIGIRADSDFDVSFLCSGAISGTYTVTRQTSSQASNTTGNATMSRNIRTQNTTLGVRVVSSSGEDLAGATTFTRFTLSGGVTSWLFDGSAAVINTALGSRVFHTGIVGSVACEPEAVRVKRDGMANFSGGSVIVFFEP